MNDPQELAQRLCVAVGVLMEDASAVAVTVTHDPEELRKKIAQLEEVVLTCSELLPIAKRLAMMTL